MMQLQKTITFPQVHVVLSSMISALSLAARMMNHDISTKLRLEHLSNVISSVSDDCDYINATQPASFAPDLRARLDDRIQYNKDSLRTISNGLQSVLSAQTSLAALVLCKQLIFGDETLESFSLTVLGFDSYGYCARTRLCTDVVEVMNTITEFHQYGATRIMKLAPNQESMAGCSLRHLNENYSHMMI